MYLKELFTRISKLKKILKYVYPLKRYNILKFELLAILLPKPKFGTKFVTSFSRKKCQNLKNKKHRIIENDEFFIGTLFQNNWIKTEEVIHTLHYWLFLCPPCVFTTLRNNSTVQLMLGRLKSINSAGIKRWSLDIVQPNLWSFVTNFTF